jgi:hypothetical protein
VTTPTYRLPDLLGGAPCEIVTQDIDREDRVRVWVKTGEDVGDYIELHRRLLVPVEPALPPEPPVGSVVLRAGRAVQRIDGAPPERPDRCWVDHLGAWWTWGELFRDDCTPVLLAPDPAAGADTEGRFPGTTNGPYAFVAGLNGGRVRLRVVDSHDESATVDLSREVTKALGRTLLAAARAARAS